MDVSDLSYTFDAFHLGVVAVGVRSSEAVKALLESRGCERLVVKVSDEVVWAWMGQRFAPGSNEIARQVGELKPTGVTYAIGEPAEGLLGWRLTHQQALLALSVARHKSQPVVRYADTMLLAAALKEPVLARSLRARYLAPLERHPDGGEKARRTLAAYLAAGQSASSAAALLDVSARTVTERIRSLESTFTRPIKIAAAEIEAALALWEIDNSSKFGNLAA